jgi:hypothetical protein
LTVTDNRSTNGGQLVRMPAGSGGFTPPSLPNLEPGNQIPTSQIAELMERRLRSLNMEMDQARQLLERFKKSSNSETSGACRRYLDDNYRLQSEMETLRIETNHHSGELTRISRATSNIIKKIDALAGESLQPREDPSSLAHLDHPASIPPVPVPAAIDEEALRRMLGEIVAASLAGIGESISSLVPVAQAASVPAEVPIGADDVSVPSVSTIPAAEPDAYQAEIEAPVPESGQTEMQDVGPKPVDEKKKLRPLKDRARQNGTFGRSHPDFPLAARYVVEFVKASPFPLSPKTISDHVRDERGLASFQVSQKDIGNRLLMMGLMRLRKKAGGGVGFWHSEKPYPEGWVS